LLDSRVSTLTAKEGLMIFDRLANAKLYLPVHKRFAAAFEFLQQKDLETLPDGEYPIEGKQLYVIVATTAGRGRTGAKLEAHRRYLDIQYVVRGQDDMGLKPTCECREVEMAYDASCDAALYRDPPTNWITVPAGSFTIFYPDDGHAPLGGEGTVTKAIVKVLIED
jgi:YhcH/YjgK/YiaL family protein